MDIVETFSSPTLKAGGVFNDDFIDSYIKLKMEEVTFQDTASKEV